jgi:ATP-binding cassette subfamily B protein
MSHDEEVLGKAYDARLMRRLLTYLSPYRPSVALAAAAIVGHSMLELAPPYLTKLVIDDYIPSGDLSGLGLVAAVFLGTLVGAFVL